MLAKAVACEAKVPLITLHAAALESKWWGETPKLLNAVFASARTRYAPCIVFFDELDGLGRARSEHDQSCVYSFKCELLRNFDSLDDAGGAVVVLACTNCPEKLDPALRRRFQRRIYVGAPSEHGRRDILRVVARHERPGEPLTKVVETVARRTLGFTGAELAVLYEGACSARLEGLDDDLLTTADVADVAAFTRRIPDLCVTHFETAATRLLRPLDDDDEDIPPSK